jgi:uridine kinase
VPSGRVECSASTWQSAAVHRDRYQASERIYVDEVDPMRHANIVVDNTDFGRPVLLRS